MFRKKPEDLFSGFLLTFVSMKIMVCKCTQCKAAKKKTNSKVKKFIKRMLNKKRRKSNEDKAYTFMYA